MHHDFGAAFDPARRSDLHDSALNIRSCRNHDALIDHDREGGLRVHRIALAAALGRNRVLQRHGYFGSGGNHDLVGPDWFARAQRWNRGVRGLCHGCSQQHEGNDQGAHNSLRGSRKDER